jgi:hypothetical protein
MSNLEPEQVKQAESAPSSPENAPESPEKKEESALYYTKWQQRMMKKGYVVTPKVKKPAKQNAMEWIATLVGALLLVLLLKAFVGSPVVVDGNSMYPTLHNGEIMIMSKLHYGTWYRLCWAASRSASMSWCAAILTAAARILSSAWWVCRAIRFKFPAATCTSTA